MAGHHDQNLLLEARGVTVTRGGQCIIHDVDITLHRQEIVTIIGPNGAGKSTLLHALLGLIPLQAGMVRRASATVIGFVPQRMQVDPVLPIRVRDFLTLSVRGSQAPNPQALLERVGGAALLERPLHGLSGGETQRVLLARALMRRPTLLVLDEPAQGVDLLGEQEIYAIVESLRHHDGVGVLLVSHDLHFVMATTDRVICLNHHVCCSGEPRLVSSHPEFLSLFGEMPTGFSYYTHHHDHHHNLHGEIKRDG